MTHIVTLAKNGTSTEKRLVSEKEALDYRDVMVMSLLADLPYGAKVRYWVQSAALFELEHGRTRYVIECRPARYEETQ